MVYYIRATITDEVGGCYDVMTIYLCFLAGGAVLPFISFILGELNSGFDMDTEVDLDVDMDIHTDTDIGADSDSIFSLGLFPTSLLALSALAVTFGALGSIMTYTGRSKGITFIIAIIAGYLASVAVQTIIKTLKRVQSNSYGINENELLLYDGKVVDAILPGQLGTVSFTTLKNVMVSYPAKCTDENVRLDTGRIVKVVELKNGIAIVEVKNKYE